MKSLVPWMVCLAMILLTNAHAVLVYDGTAANLSAPSDDPGWDAVGSVYTSSPSTGPGTALFLGNEGGYGWFLTANHLSLSGATLSIGGDTYNIFANESQIGSVDLKVFRINTTLAGISPVSLSSNVPNINDSVTMIGYGKTGTKTTWDTSGTGTWTSPGTDAEGYTWSDPNVKRWGTNTILATNRNTASGVLLATDFDDVAGEAQGSLGDSGGGVFRKDGLNWELAALIVAVGRVEDSTLSFSGFADQPSSTSVASITGEPNNKSTTYAIQISNYRTAILNAIPEPSALALVLLAGSCGIFFGSPRRRMR